MDEKGASIEEKPATHRIQMQRWMWFTIGAIGLFLLILTIWNIATRADQKEAEKESEEQVKLSTPKEIRNDPMSEFDEIKTDYQQAADNPKYVLENGDPLKPGNQDRLSALRNEPRSEFDSKTDRIVNRVRTQSGQQTQQANDTEKTLMQQAIEQWKVQEELRGLNSSRVAFDFGATAQTTFTQSSSHNGQNNDTAEASDSFDSRIKDLEQRRLKVKEKIQQAEQLRDQLLGKEINPDDIQRQISSLTGDFKKAPKDIVGYTKENSYDADVEGKVAIPPGTVINAIFTLKSVSDYAGSTVKGMLSHDVYDVSKQFVLLPKGTELVLKSLQISNVNEPIQARMGYVVKWAVRPDGKKIDFSKAAFADREGVGAIKDKVNRHIFAQFMGVAAYALIASETSREGSGITQDTTYRGQVGGSLRDQFAPLASKYLNLVPTVTIRNGQTFKLILEDEVFVEPWKDVYENYYN